MCNCHQHILTEGLKQKVLLEAAGEFNLTVPNIKKYYTIWNKKAFDNKCKSIDDVLAQLGDINKT